MAISRRRLFGLFGVAAIAGPTAVIASTKPASGLMILRKSAQSGIVPRELFDAQRQYNLARSRLINHWKFESHWTPAEVEILRTRNYSPIIYSRIAK